jgi:hypothetical protein
VSVGGEAEGIYGVGDAEPEMNVARGSFYAFSGGLSTVIW